MAACGRRLTAVDRFGAAVPNQPEGTRRDGDRKRGEAGEDEHARRTAGGGPSDPWSRVPTGRRKHRILLQDAALEPLQAPARLQPDLLGERPVDLLVGLSASAWRSER